jgi:hypothetical protein
MRKAFLTSAALLGLAGCLSDADTTEESVGSSEVTGIAAVQPGMRLDSVLAKIGEGPVRPAHPGDSTALFHGYRRQLMSAGPALYTLLLFRATPGTTADSVSRSVEIPILLIRDSVVLAGWQGFDSLATLRKLPNPYR